MCLWASHLTSLYPNLLSLLLLVDRITSFWESAKIMNLSVLDCVRVIQFRKRQCIYSFSQLTTIENLYMCRSSAKCWKYSSEQYSWGLYPHISYIQMQETDNKLPKWSEVAQSCPTLSDPMDCSPPGSSIHGIFQARVLEWGAIHIPYNSPT